jgi:2,3-bisphosphoglycerate-independent phosphoglycerate mutase
MCLLCHAAQELLDAVDQVGGRYLVTADHGNAEDMVQVSWNTNFVFLLALG